MQAATLIDLCLQKGLKLTFAESCTGGLLSSLITDVPGASRVFVGGAVTYANEAKRDIIGVRQSSLDAYGAVSEQVAREMAAGVCKAFSAEVSASITGVAGPGGGSAEKPVGTVHIATCVQGVVSHQHFVFSGDRASIRQQSAEAAISLLIDALIAL